MSRLPMTGEPPRPPGAGDARPPRVRAWADRLLVILAVFSAGLFVATWAQFLLGGGAANIGVDYVLYRDAATSWLSGGPFYLPHQLSEPYVITHGDVLYPPPILVVLVPFTVLPAVVWWLVPVAVTGYVVVGYRPRPWAWLAISLCLLFPITGVKILHGNPGLWFAAAIAAGMRLAWPSVLVFLKPTLLPFAFIGVRRRSWWLGLAVLAVTSLAFLPMWPDYVAVLRNGQAEMGLLYSLNEVPLVAIPVIAWIGRRPGAGDPEPA